MIELKSLNIYTKSDSDTENDTLFPSDIAPVEIINFSFDSPSMGIPMLTVKLNHKECLDDKWNYRQYVELFGEKYWVSKIPTSSKDNTDHRYKHEISFVSERNILTNIYFYDIVNSESEQGKYHSNSANVLFYGTFEEFITRINASLTYSNVGYSVILDNLELGTEIKEFSCDKTFVWDALLQAFETWDIPFYFKGKECHFNNFSVDLSNKSPLEYGNDNALLKIQRTNANTRIITRATGVGSTENIPFYYPNKSEKGDFVFEIKNADSVEVTNYEIVDNNKLATTLENGVIYKYTDISNYTDATISDILIKLPSLGLNWNTITTDSIINITNKPDKPSFRIFFSVNYPDDIKFAFLASSMNAGSFMLEDFQYVSLYRVEDNKEIQTWWNFPENTIVTNTNKSLSGEYYFYLHSLNIDRSEAIDYPYDISTIDVFLQTTTTASETTKIYSWVPQPTGTQDLNLKKIKSLKNAGVVFEESESVLGYTFRIDIDEDSKVPYQEKLMPSIFSRGKAFDGAVTNKNAEGDITRGVERYYNAKNNVYPNITFKNELNDFNRSENIYEYKETKPSIEYVTNASGQSIAKIVDVAYDDDDNDDTMGEEYGEDSNNYQHPYFYIKIRKTDSQGFVENGYSANDEDDYSFNLFNRATGKDSITIQMTSGNLSGCKFKVQVVDKGNNVFKNPVQVDSSGNIVAGNKGAKVSLSNFIDSQQDSRTNEVWLVLLKDQDTFGTILPSQTNGQVVNVGDTFNITGIHMPESYILAAESMLDNSIVSDMAKENEEIFNFSVEFSRIFLKEDFDTNRDNSWVSILRDSAKIPIKYNNKVVTPYVSSYSIECNGDELLPKISIELSNTLRKTKGLVETIESNTSSKVLKTTPNIVKNQINNSNIAFKASTLAGYGITDAKIEDGTITLGRSSVAIPKEVTSLDWSQITNKPDYFELDENGDVKVKGGKGFWSESFISTKGVSSDTDDTGTGGTGVDLTRMWEELASVDATKLIDISHMPSSVKTAVNWVSTITSDDDTDAKIDKWNEIVSFLSGISDTSSLNSILSGKANTSVVTALGTRVTTIESNYVAKTRKISAGTGLTGGGDLSADRTLSLATIGTAGTYTKVVVDAYGRVTGNSTLLESDIPALSIGKITNLQSTINTINANFANYLPLTGGVMKNTNLVTNLNADLLDGVHLADVYRKSGWNRVIPYIYTNETLYYYWFKVAQINYTTAQGLAELEVAAVSDANYMYAASARLTIKGYSGVTPSCSVSLASNAYLSTRINVALDKDGGVWVKTNCSWASYLRWRTIVNDENYTGITILNGSTKQLDQPVGSNIIGENTGTTYRKSTDAFETLHATFDVGVGCFRSPTAQVRIVPYTNSAYIEFGNPDFTKNVPAYITGYNSSPLDLLTISSHSTIFSGTVTIGGINGVTLSYDATNDMLKFSKGGYFLGAVSTKGVSNDTGTGGTGVDLSAVWESLANNTDVYGSTKIHIDHIPTLTKSKISDFPTLVSAFANDAGYITASAIINKADKATTLAGYGITDAMPFLDMVNASNLKSIGVGYVNANGANGKNGGIISFGTASYQTQIHSDYLGGNIHWRVNSNGTLTSWRNILDSNNYSNYAVTLNTNQTITGLKTFSNGLSATKISGITDSSVVANLHAQYSTNLIADNNRNADELPYGYGSKAVNWRFKENIAIGITDGGSYSGVLHLTPWTDPTGGVDNQLAFTFNGKIKYRSGLSTWGEWIELLTFANGVTLCTDQTITGNKTFRNSGYYAGIFNSTLESGETRLLLMNNNTAKLMLAYDGLGSFLYDYGSAQTLRIQNDGDLLFTKSIIASSQLKSNVATGTAPLVVNSTTMVANLNANALSGVTIDALPNYLNTAYKELNLYSYVSGTDPNTGEDIIAYYDPDTWYPCVLQIDSRRPTRIRIWNSLYSSNAGWIPSWGTHTSGFTLNLEWEVVGSAWGSTSTQRTIKNYNYAFTSDHLSPCGGIDQNPQVSREVVWLRGGTKYRYKTDNNASFIIYREGYSWTDDNNNKSYTAPLRYASNSDAAKVIKDPRISRHQSLLAVAAMYADTIFLGQSLKSYLQGNDDGSMNLIMNGSSRVDIDSYGLFTFYQNIAIRQTSARLTMIRDGYTGLFIGFNSDISSPNRGVYDFNLGEWLVGTNGTQIFLGDRNVGIGTQSPAYKLDVNGTARVTQLMIGEAAISWDSVNGMLKVDRGAYFTGSVSTKGVSNGSGLVAVAQFGITWHDAWAIDAGSTHVESFGTTTKSISEGQGTTNGSTITIVSDAFSGKKIGDIEIFTLGWGDEAPANVRLAPYKISGNTLYCSLLLSGTMSQATFKIKIY